MKIHIITVGKPKLDFAKLGWEEYFGRLSHYHQLRYTPIPDKQNDSKHLLEAIGNSYCVVLEIKAEQQSSEALAASLAKWALLGKELSFVIGGPDGLPAEVLDRADYQWSLGRQTLPHDLAMIVLLEALYRASSISAGQPYHR
jgi:23S rRNA (pseudouridine1915-N3)-methyltransferase